LRIPHLNIIHPNRVVAISVYYIDQQAARYQASILKKVGSKIEVEKISEQEDNLEALSDYFLKNIPVVLNVSGRVVLNKIVDKADFEATAEQFISGDNESDFYGYAIEQDKQTTFSLIRKELLEGLLQEFRALKSEVVYLGIGPFGALILSQFGLTDATEIPIDGGILTNTEEQPELKYQAANEINKSAAQLSIGDQQLFDYQTLSYSLALAYLLKESLGQFYKEAPKRIVRDYQFKHLLRLLRFPALIIIFIGLLANFFVFDSLRKKENVLQGQLNMNAGLIEKLDSLENELRAKESYIEFIGLNKTHFSTMLDQLAQTVPSGITLESLEMNPIQKKLRDTEPLNFGQGIEIYGLANNSLTLNKWTKQLVNLGWIKNVEVVNYHVESNSSKGIFALKLTLR
jgi:Tfp pilus assembly protein PilN